MRRFLLQSTAFVRRARRLVKKRSGGGPYHSGSVASVGGGRLSTALKTHKLKGELAGSWACSLGYDLRIVFEFVQHEGAEAILLQTVGTHDEVL